MKICIMGAGVIGLTTAWWLSKRGYDVTIVDRRSITGQETSFGNGAQLSYGFVAPLASPDTLKKLPSLLLSKAAPIRVRPSLDPDFIRWGIDFLRACNEKSVKQTTAAQLALAALSRAELTSLTEDQTLEFNLRTAGKLVVYRKRESFDAALKQIELQKQLSSDNEDEIMSSKDCLEFEPALRMKSDAISGASYSRNEQVGDCAEFCAELTTRLKRLNTVTWQLDTDIEGAVVKDGNLVALKTTSGEIQSDLFVLSTASNAAGFAKKAGFRLPVYPMKGYSITVEQRPNGVPLAHSVTDFDQKIVFAPLMRKGMPVVRAAGIADLVGNTLEIDQKRLSTIIRLTTETLDIDTDQNLSPWAGLRPATPDSRPIIGWSPIKNLFLNTGHGALGWTLACGSARLTADLISRENPPLDAHLFSLDRH